MLISGGAEGWHEANLATRGTDADQARSEVRQCISASTLARMRAERSARQAATFRTLRRPAVALVASLLAAGALAGAGRRVAGSPGRQRQLLLHEGQQQRDPTFNQLLGINDSGLIAGYFGSGEAAHPNRGYRVSAPYGQGNFHSENFPHSAQTQVTGLNNTGITVGFYVDSAGAQQGFYYSHRPLPHGQLSRPTTRPSRQWTSCSASTTPASRSGSSPMARARTTATSTTSGPTASTC